MEYGLYTVVFLTTKNIDFESNGVASDLFVSPSDPPIVTRDKLPFLKLKKDTDSSLQ